MEGGEVKPNSYAVLSRCVEEGILCGIRRYHKHRDASSIPSEDHHWDHADAINCIHMAVMESISEYFKFDEPED